MSCGCRHCDCDGSSRYLYSVDDILAVLNRIAEHGRLIMKSGSTRWYEVDRWTIITQFYGDRFDFVEYLESPSGQKVDFWNWADPRDETHPVTAIMDWNPVGALPLPPDVVSS